MTRGPGGKTSERVRGLRSTSPHQAMRRSSVERAQAVSVSKPKRCGSGGSGSHAGCERGRRQHDRQSAWRVDSPSLNRKGEVVLLARGLNPGACRRACERSWRSGSRTASSVLAGDDGTQRSSRTRWLFQRVSRRKTGYREEGRHPRRGAPKCGAGVAERRRRKPTSWVRARRDARLHGVRRASKRSKRARQ